MEVSALAWVAGVIEGEGTIHVRNRGSHRTVVLAIVMTDLDVLDRVQQILGVGNIVGPYTPRPGTKPQWHWNVTCARDVAAVVMTLYPLLGLRRRGQAREVLEAWRSMPGRGRRRYC